MFMVTVASKNVGSCYFTFWSSVTSVQEEIYCCIVIHTVMVRFSH